MYLHERAPDDETLIRRSALEQVSKSSGYALV